MYAGLARWNWAADEGESAWRGPPGCTATLDLRALPAQAIAGGTGGWGLFGFDSDPSAIPGVVVLGDDPQGTVGPLRREALRRAFDLPVGVDFAAARLGPMIFEGCTRLADPTGQARLKPLLPETYNRAALRFGAFTAHRAFDLADPDHGAMVRAVIRENYRRIRARGGPYLKYLGWLCRRYRTGDYRQFQPADLPDEEPVAPSTTYTESFDQTDSTTLGPDLTWTETLSDLQTVSNQLRTVGATFAEARAELNLSSDDHSAKITVVSMSATASQSVRALARFASGARTHYGAYLERTSGNVKNRQLFKRVTGTFTQLASTNVAWADGDIVKCDCNGSTIRLLRNDVQEESATDTAITGNLRGGAAIQEASGGSAIGDNFEVADTAAEAARRKFVYRTHSRLRASKRAA